MNDNLNTLAKQSGIDLYGLGRDREKWEKCLQTFSTLIIQECLDKIETHKIPVGNSAAGELAADWTYDALDTISSNIREHFGVK
jgi:hypothetical protein